MSSVLFNHLGKPVSSHSKEFVAEGVDTSGLVGLNDINCALTWVNGKLVAIGPLWFRFNTDGTYHREIDIGPYSHALLQWMPTSTLVGATSCGDAVGNTAKMSTTGGAAEWCTRRGGILPSIMDLPLIYNARNTINSQYSNQAVIQSTGYAWSSTENNATNANNLNLNNGDTNNNNKTNSNWCFPLRGIFK